MSLKWYRRWRVNSSDSHWKLCRERDRETERGREMMNGNASYTFTSNMSIDFEVHRTVIAGFLVLEKSKFQLVYTFAE